MGADETHGPTGDDELPGTAKAGGQAMSRQSVVPEPATSLHEKAGGDPVSEHEPEPGSIMWCGMRLLERIRRRRMVDDPGQNRRES